MSPYAKVAQSVIRLIAFGLIVLSLALYSADVFVWLSDTPIPRPVSVPRHPAHLVLKAIPSIVALVLYWKSKAMAIRLTRDLD